MGKTVGSNKKGNKEEDKKQTVKRKPIDMSLTRKERDLLMPYCDCGCNGFWSYILPKWMMDMRASPHCIKNDFVKEEVVEKLREKRRLAEESKAKESKGK